MQHHSQWQTDERFPEPARVGDGRGDLAGHSQQLRSPLGQFIERSTSSPHSRTMFDPNTNDSLVGSDLLDYVTNGYSEISLQRSLPQRHVSSGVIENQKGSGVPAPFDRRASLNIDDNTLAQHQAGVLVNDFFPLGTSTTDREGTNGSRFQVGGSVAVTSETSVDGSLSTFHSLEGDSRYRGFVDSSTVSSAGDIERSQSASIPYLPSRGSSSFGPTMLHDSLSSTPFDQRAVSVGNEAPFGAMATQKFLPDDVTPDFLHRRSASMGPQLFNVDSGAGAYDLSDRRSTSPHVNRADRGMGNPMASRSQVSQFHIDEFAVGAIPSTQQQDLLHHSLHSPMPSRGSHGGGPVSPTYRQAISVEPTSHGALYSQPTSHPAHIRVNSGQPFQQQQQIYVGSHSNNVQHGSQPQGLQLQGLQVQVLPNGQTVFVSTTAPPQQSFGNATLLYHSQQHPQLINGASGQRDEYVSLIPIQRGNQQVPNWQSDAASLYPTNGLIYPGSDPIVLGGLDNAHDSDGTGGYHPGGRSREAKNGRGRRGNIKGRGDTKSSASSSSMLLEEFRSSKSRDWTVRRIEGHVVEFCQDQNGSRFIQQRLEMGDTGEQQVVMKEVLPAIRRLRNDVFGNYVVQKLLDFGSPKTKADIRDTLEGEILPLSLQMYGCRVVQKALETLDEDDLPRILREFHNNVLSCIQDQNGNHVIQKCVEVLNSRARKAVSAGDLHRASFLSEQVDFVLDDVLANTTLLSCHPYGCRVLQRILEHCAEKKKTILLDEIKKCHKTLLDDQYGNYVIQHVLQYGRDGDRDSIVQIVVENGLLGLSRQKFASNVVEKLLKYGNGDQRRAIVREMLKYADDSSTPSEPGDGHTVIVLLMVRDAYANYVVQTTLDVVPESDEKKKLLHALNAHADELRNYTFAKHIVAKLHSMNEANGNNHHY